MVWNASFCYIKGGAGMKGSFQDWLNVLERPVDEDHTDGSGGPYTRSLLCGVIFSTVGMCWRLGFFSRFDRGEFFQTWVRLAGYILLSLLLFTLGMVCHQTLSEGKNKKRRLPLFWLLLGGGVSGLILLL